MKKFWIITIICICFGCSSKTEINLSSLDISKISSGWGKPQMNSSITQKPMSIGGRAFKNGVGTHAYSEAHIKLDGRKGRFETYVGIDDNTSSDSLASVIFYIITNKGIAFNSGLMKKGDAAMHVSINLNGITDMFLVVDATSDGKDYDHANWADARFYVSSTPAIVDGSPDEDFYILTPKPSEIPRINGAKIFGASAGKPFLFTIATTGKRPMTFQAEGLPEGLVLDEGRGIITGKCQKNGRYNVKVTAKNEKGQCSDDIEIVVGESLALTPHMGWNSWYIYGPWVTQKNMEESAKAMYDEGLVNFGYMYVNIDDGWEIKVGSDDPVVGGNVREKNGTIRTNKKFPYMKAMTDYIHSLGFKAGLYSSPGVMTCAGYAGSLGHEARDVKTFSDWGFDFLKYDWCSYSREVEKPVSLAECRKPYELIGKLCKEADRDIVLNMCQYGMGDVWKWGREVGGHSWRTTGDINGGGTDLISNMFNIGFFQEKLKNYSGPGGWNDPDYLLVGNIYDWDSSKIKRCPFSPSEQYTYMTLWSILSVPLIFSGDLTSLDDFTKNILCNAEVIDVNQDKLGKQGYCIYNKELIEIWQKELSDGSKAMAVFNRRPVESEISIRWDELGFDSEQVLRDLWRQKDVGKTGENGSFKIPRHGCMFFKVSKTNI
ncbi:MAG: NPCBM/NEW2 domain-containing protein [Bacteroidales bacterium]|jgi:alpha-galactosidase|nr:NPCBM/NEW2 domain-containing protein [Bacteroidales bacterium]